MGSTAGDRAAAPRAAGWPIALSLPPGLGCIINEDDARTLVAYFDALSQGQSLHRPSVRVAAAQFATDRIVDSALEQLTVRRFSAP